eukprot:gnl/TRDRNA2_/TRDRNA2_195934_c0_seq1.p1 gnl/TRDRNA2_/TRDRNA2_195934_c0~~gnl/TRDRNA2_/TRDRNA2_195934_c0_seq1.p1  ORF type:complete len:270 (-),score=25.87 gnl/TRDRNA2_/TRDRNA2_195934_c0_seq1:16-825(-)
MVHQAITLILCLLLDTCVVSVKANGVEVTHTAHEQDLLLDQKCVNSDATTFMRLPTNSSIPPQWIKASDTQPVQKCKRILFNWWAETFSRNKSNTSNITLLDIGGGKGYDLYELTRMDGRLQPECVDTRPLCPGCKKFDGRSLKHYPDKSFDFVSMTFVLHHAAQYSFPLLREAKRVAKNRIIILEDLKADNPEGKLNQAHHGNGHCIFRKRNEWAKIFTEVGLQIMEEDDDSAHKLRNCFPGYKTDRAFWVLAPWKSAIDTKPKLLIP